MDQGVETMENEQSTAGWDAITARFGQLYPGQDDPLHYGTIIAYEFGGGDPLDGVSIYDGGDFWHFVTYGFSELYDKESDNDEWSGYGFELTMRLLKSDNIDEQELKGVVRNLQTMARYVFGSGRGFSPYQYLYTGQQTGMDVAGTSILTGYATAPDAAGTIETLNGKVEFVCLVGLTDAELQVIMNKEKTVEQVLEQLGSDITDYNRTSVI
jgi:hypothetical protein